MRMRIRTPLGSMAPNIRQTGEMELGQAVLLGGIEYEVTGVLPSIEPGVDQFVILDAVLRLNEASEANEALGLDRSR